MNRWLALAMVCVGCGNDVPIQGDFGFALDGPGFFALRKGASDVFTRDGHFTLDADGFLVGRGGYRLQGFSQNSGTTGDLRIGPFTAAPVATSSIVIRANLDAAAPVASSPFDLRDPWVGASFASTTTVFDSLGTPMTIDVYWQHIRVSKWAFHALTDGSGVSGGTHGDLFEIASGTLGFDSQGQMVSQVQTSEFRSINAPQPQALSFELSGVTQFAEATATTYLSQDGCPNGLLERVQLDFGGRIVGTCSHGELRELGRVSVALFAAPTGLQPISGCLLLATPASGPPALGASGVGGRADIVPNALEQRPDESTGCER